MSSIKRRHFLQFAGSTLAAMGLSQTDFLSQATRYSQAAAQTPARKLALLIGINDYSGNDSAADLRGCLTDVDLQYELLVNRFGFDPGNIVRITDKQPLKPTRKNILKTFRSHLIDQAEPGDVVVFHYSGHGSYVFDPDPVYEGFELNGTIMPSDPVAEGSDLVPDIMGRTLFLLMRAIRTDNVTAILDSCHSGGGLRGNSVVRAVNRSGGRAMPEEFELQARLLEEANLSFEDFQRERAAGIAKGVGVGSAQLSQLAFDTPNDGFYSGAFTYLLTRYLWQMPGGIATDRVQTNLIRSTQTKVAAERSLAQIPKFQVAPGSDGLVRPIYFTQPVKGSAEAVVTEVAENEEIVFWLGGVSSQLLGLTDTQAGFTVLNEQREPVGEIEQTERYGFVGVGKLVSGWAVPGMLMRETVVGLPANLQLRIGVDSSLGAQVSEAVEWLSNVAVSAQTGRSQILASPVDRQTPVDYIFTRMDEAQRAQLAEDGFDTARVPPAGTFLLVTPALEPVPLSFNLENTTVVDAVEHLRLRFKVLLANKAIGALAAIKSELAVTGAIYAESDSNRSIAIEGVVDGDVRSLSTPIAAFKAGENVKIRVENNNPNQPIYVSCIAVHSDGNMTVIYPNDWDAPEDAALVAPNAEIVLPRLEDENIRYAFALDEGKEADFSEVVTLASTSSLRNMLRALQEISSNRGDPRYSSISLRGGALDFLGTVLGDVDRVSRGDGAATGAIAPENTAVDGRAIAVFSTLVEIVKP